MYIVHSSGYYVPRTMYIVHRTAAEVCVYVVSVKLRYNNRIDYDKQLQIMDARCNLVVYHSD